MAWMGLHLKLLLENAGQDWGGPDARVQTVSDRPAFHDGVELLALRGRQGRRPAAPMAFLNPLQAVFIPEANPSMNTRAMNVEEVGHLGWGVPVGAEEEGLQTEGHAWGLVGVSRLAQGQELAAGASVGGGKDRLHVVRCRVTRTRMVRPRRPAGKKQRWERLPSEGGKKQRTASKPAQDKGIVKWM